MKLNAFVSVSLLAAILLASGAIVLSRSPSLATAAQSTGSITGQVVWNAPLPVPYGATPQEAPGVAAPDVVSPGGPDAAPDATPDGASGSLPPSVFPISPGVRPYPRLIPAGAVLVAVQGTDLSTRTDDQGMFRIDNVPTGQYLMVAAGPVQNVSTAVAVRPNVFVKDASGTVNLGRLYLGQTYYGGGVPYAAAPDAGAGVSEPDQTAP